MPKVLYVTITCDICKTRHRVDADDDGVVPKGRFQCLRCGHTGDPDDTGSIILRPPLIQLEDELGETES